MPFEVGGVAVETWYRVTGDLGEGGAPLIVLHGGPGAAHDYLLSLTDLRATARAVDPLRPARQRPQHASPGPRRGVLDGRAVRPRAAQPRRATRASRDRYHVLGQSWGGFLAQEYAFTSPGRAALARARRHRRLVPGLRRRGQPAPRRTSRPSVEATLRRHEEAGTTDDPEYAAGVHGLLRPPRLPARPVAARGDGGLRAGSNATRPSTTR